MPGEQVFTLVCFLLLLGIEQIILLSMVKSSPHLYLDEIKEWFEDVCGKSLGIATIWLYLKRMGLSRVKVSIRAYQRDEYARAEHIRFMAKFKTEMFLFVDETSVDQRTPQRKHCHYPKGLHAPPMLGNFVRRNRISVLGGMDVDGIVGSFVVENSYNADLFRMAFQQSLLPHLGRLSLYEPRSIVVMDNCSIHLNAELIDCIRQAGAIVHFLPPYSPDFNPIEMIFNYLKCWLRRNYAIAGQQPKASVYMAFDELPNEYARHCVEACGY